MRALSPIIALVLILGVSIAVTLLVGTFLLSTARRGAATVETQMEQRIRCTYANFYIEAANLDCNLDCTRGVDHEVNIVLRNTGQVELEINGVYIETSGGDVVVFNGSETLSPGETLNFSASTLDACASMIGQTQSSYVVKIKRIYVVSQTCPGAGDSLGEGEVKSYVTFIECNQTEAQPSRYSILLFHFNEGSGSVVYDSSGNANHGTLYGSYEWVS